MLFQCNKTKVYAFTLLSLATIFPCVVNAVSNTSVFNVSVTATVPSTFRLVTTDGLADTISITFPSTTYDATTENFEDKIIPVKFIGNVNDNDITLTADSLELINSTDGNIKLPMMVNISTNLSDENSSEFIITSQTPSVTLSGNEVDYNGFELGFGFVSLVDVAPGQYEGAIKLTAQQDI